jgi:hypothetical protein
MEKERDMITTAENIDRHRRRFLGAAAISAGVVQLGALTSAKAQAASGNTRMILCLWLQFWPMPA